MRTTYRDDLAAARIQRDELLARRRAELDDALARGGWVYVDRVARSVAGLTAIAGAVLVALLAAFNGVTGAFGEPSFARYPRTHATSGVLTASLILVCAGAVAAYFAGRRSARRALASFTRATLPAAGEDVHADLERLRASPPPSRILEMAAARERAGVTYPLMGFVLLAPLAIHFVVYSFFQLPMSGRLAETRDFDRWIAVSVLVVGHCHVVAALLQRRLGGLMIAWDNDALAAGEPRSLGVLGWTIFASFLPGLIAFLKEPGLGVVIGLLVAIFVAVTGVVVIPTSASWMRRRLVVERAALD
jgi:hypothetical protein